MQMTEGTIAEWLVPDGEVVEAGQAIVMISTDKTDAEVGAPVGGTLHIVVPAGDTVEVGVVIATFGE
jgi:2-oxoglutarate dehydrogenase E2 component (dihydrolipoamide succinyltransferase)